MTSNPNPNSNMRFLLKPVTYATAAALVIIPIIRLGSTTTAKAAHVPIKSRAKMVRYAARCSYRGCKYHGFQLQLPAKKMTSKRIGRRDEAETKTVQVR